MVVYLLFERVDGYGDTEYIYSYYLFLENFSQRFVAGMIHIYRISYVIHGLLIGKNEIYGNLKHDMHASNSNA